MKKMRNSKKILFDMTINVDTPDVEKQYTIFDSEPSFFSLSNLEKKAFIRREEQKIKQIISRALSPRFQQ